MKRKSIFILIIVLFTGYLFTQKKEIKIPLVDDAFIVDINPWNALEIGKDNKIYIADRRNYQIKIFSPKGKYISSFGRRGEGPGSSKNRDDPHCDH